MDSLPALTRLDLWSLTEVEGDLTLQYTGLASLDGLSALEHVAGDVVISDNPGLDDDTIRVALQGVRNDGRIRITDNGP